MLCYLSGLQSCDDVWRLTKLFSLVPDLLQLFEQVGDLHPQLSVILLKLTTLCGVARCRLARQLTTQQRLFLFAMILRLRTVTHTGAMTQSRRKPE